MTSAELLDTVRDGSASTAALDRIAALAARLLHTPMGLVSLVTDELHCVVGAGGEDSVGMGREFPLDYSFCRHVVLTEQPLVVTDAVADPRVADNPAVHEYGIASYAGMPLHDSHGQVVGSLCVNDHVSRTWSEEDLRTLRDLAESASTQLAFAELARDRENARAELEKNTVFQGAVLEHLTDGVVACDSEGRLAYFNQALRTIHGISEQAITGTDWAATYDLYEPDERTVMAQDRIPLARAFAGERVEQQHMVVRRHGDLPRHFWVNGGPLIGADGRRLGAAVAMHDITDDVRRRRLRQAQLSVATVLADGSDEFEEIYSVLGTLRHALSLSGCEYLELDDSGRELDEVVALARERDQLVQSPVAGGYAVAMPVTVGKDVVGVLHLTSASDTLLDDLTASTVTAIGTLLGRSRERRRLDALQRDLSSARAVLEQVVDQINDFVFSVVVEPTGGLRPVFRSRSEGVLGGPIPPEENWDDFFSARVRADNLAEVERWRAEIRAGLPSQMTCRIRGYDDVERWIWVRSKPRLHDGELFVDGICMDVTERQVITLEREELLRSRKQQVQQLQALDRLKDEFVATVTHEIRGPLGLLTTFAESVAQGLHDRADLDPAVQRKADLVHANAEHLQLVVENIFDLARLDAGGVQLHKQECSVQALLGALAEQYQRTAGDRGVGLTVAACVEGLSVHADPIRLRQALENLLTNALKFTPSGGVVDLDGSVDDGWVVFRVRDNGIGIPQEDLPHLFTRFYRASNAHSGQTPGTGLGLAVTQTVVTAHEGTVSVRSATDGPQTGTTFEVRIPAAAR